MSEGYRSAKMFAAIQSHEQNGYNVLIPQSKQGHWPPLVFFSLSTKEF